MPNLTKEQVTKIFVGAATASITLAAFSTLAVSTVMPVVVAQLKGTELYTLGFGIPLAGQLISTAIAGPYCDARGPRWPIFIGVLCFIGGLAMSGFAHNMMLFIIGRAVMGFGGGALMVSVYVLVGALVPSRQRPRAFAYFAAAWALPAVIGPWLAGQLTELTGSWRVVFWGVIPFVLVLVVLLLPTLRFIPPQHREPDVGSKRLAIASFVAGLGVMVILIFSVTPSLYSRLLVIIGVVAIVLAVPRMFPRGTFKLKKGLPSIMASRGTVNAAFVATESFLPLMLQHGRGWTPAHSGLVLTAGAVTYALGSVAQSKIKNDELRHKLPRWGGATLALGIVITSLGAFTFIPAWITVIGWAIGGTGLGFSYPALAAMALQVAPAEKHGVVSASVQLADTLGSATALAAITALFSAVAMYPPPWPYLPGPAIALLLALVATVAGARIGTLPKTGSISVINPNL